MLTTPPMDNKQEPVEYTADATWGDSCEHYFPNGKDAGVALKRLLAKLDAQKDDAREGSGDCVFKSNLSFDEIVAAAMKALAHKRESTEEEL